MKTKTRAAAIALIRAELLKMVDDEHSVCRLAAERNIFCRGFCRYSDGDLRRRYWWLARPALTREMLEQRANLWQLARQIYHGVPLACDVQKRDRDACNGWDDFSNDDLTRFCHELTGAEVVISG